MKTPLAFLMILLLTHNSYGINKIVFLSISVNNQKKENDNYVKETLFFEKIIETNSIFPIKKRSLLANQATNHNCFLGLNWLKTNCKKENLGLIYIGTHGYYSKNFGYCFGTYDKYIETKEVKLLLKGAICPIVIIIDTCYGGGFIEDWGDWDNGIIIASSSKNEYSYPYGFTLPFCHSLKYGDYDENGYLSIEEINYYISFHSTQTLTVSKNKFNIELMKARSYYLWHYRPFIFWDFNLY